MKYFKLALSASLIFSLFLGSCTNQSLRIFKSKSARTEYLNTLNSSGIGETKIGKEWQTKAKEAISESVELEIPFAIQGSFKSKSIDAKAWQVNLEQGASIIIQIDWQPADSSRLIVDLLEGPEWKELESKLILKDSLRFEASKSGQYLLRIQPELLGEGNFQVVINGTSTYAVFPVLGKNSESIQSFWGATRDGGARSHEGVDIFATRGTPVIAPVAGVVSSVRDRGLGGKQVWIRDSKRNWSLYFAHLDSQLVSERQRVVAGDTLGLVGNTGNAKTTAPHLHFGIYQRGAINPLPAIRTEFKEASALPIVNYQSVMLINVPQANLRKRPSTQSEIMTSLTAGSPVFILAATADFFQIKTISGATGFMAKNLLIPPAKVELSNSQALTFFNPFTSDSLLVNLGEFKKIGKLDGFEMIMDSDENILYLPIAR